MSKRSRPRLPDSQPFATLLESRPGVPRPIPDHTSVDVDDLPGVHTSPVRHSAVLASVDAHAPRLRDPETRPARRALARNLMELAALLESRTDHGKPPVRESGPVDPRRAATRAKLERAAREAREQRLVSRARRGRR